MKKIYRVANSATQATSIFRALKNAFYSRRQPGVPLSTTSEIFLPTKTLGGYGNQIDNFWEFLRQFCCGKLVRIDHYPVAKHY